MEFLSCHLSILLGIMRYERQDGLKDDFAEYTKCGSCQQALMNCDCNCPFCGTRDECECELSPITIEY